mmetsp:Transcript_42569/g.59136  ORF Transcript_42569/g.59136 Transcript_42569/m.59136 type:complete len:176 (-) Transcript_42569:96-623(-)
MHSLDYHINNLCVDIHVPDNDGLNLDNDIYTFHIHHDYIDLISVNIHIPINIRDNCNSDVNVFGIDIILIHNFVNHSVNNRIHNFVNHFASNRVNIHNFHARDVNFYTTGLCHSDERQRVCGCGLIRGRCNRYNILRRPTLPVGFGRCRRCGGSRSPWMFSLAAPGAAKRLVSAS